MEETINIREIFRVLRKRLWLITLIAIVAATCSAVVSFFVLTPIYETKTQILVNQSKSEQQLYTPQTVQTNVQLINTYNDIIKSPAILDKVVKKLNLKQSAQSLSSQIQVTSAQDSQVAQIVVQGASPKLVTEIANTTASVFKEEVPKLMNIDNVSVLSKAHLSTSLNPVKPKPFINIAVALVFGLMAGAGIAIWLEYLDNTIKTEKDVADILQIPLIGVVSDIKDVPTATSITMETLNSKLAQRGEKFGS